MEGTDATDRKLTDLSDASTVGVLDSAVIPVRGRNERDGKTVVRTLFDFAPADATDVERCIKALLVRTASDREFIFERIGDAQLGDDPDEVRSRALTVADLVVAFLSPAYLTWSADPARRVGPAVTMVKGGLVAPVCWSGAFPWPQRPRAVRGNADLHPGDGAGSGHRSHGPAWSRPAGPRPPRRRDGLPSPPAGGPAGVPSQGAARRRAGPPPRRQRRTTPGDGVGREGSARQGRGRLRPHQRPGGRRGRAPRGLGDVRGPALLRCVWRVRDGQDRCRPDPHPGAAGPAGVGPHGAAARLLRPPPSRHRRPQAGRGTRRAPRRPDQTGVAHRRGVAVGEPRRRDHRGPAATGVGDLRRSRRGAGAHERAAGPGPAQRAAADPRPS